MNGLSVQFANLFYYNSYPLLIILRYHLGNHLTTFSLTTLP